MRRVMAVALVGSVFQLACSDSGRSAGAELLAPSASRSGLDNLAVESAPRTVQIRDDCDPTTFNLAVEPGTCVGKGDMTFAAFIAELTRDKQVKAWRFNPDEVKIELGRGFVAVNRGGEVHTFTEVKAFGGGIIAPLNALSGNPVPAPECLQLAPSDFIPPGGSQSDTPSEAGSEKYQCCIHPWMRAVVSIRGR